MHLDVDALELGDLLDEVGDGARQVADDGRHVDALFNDDVHVDDDAAVAGGDVDDLADAGAGQQAGDAGLLVNLGHADDAVALEGGIAREVGNAVIGHTKRSWNGTRHEVSSR